MSSHLRQTNSHLPSRPSRSCMTLPAIFRAPPRDQDENRLCCINIPSIISHLSNSRRHRTRTWKRKERDSRYWKRVYEYPNLNDEERLLAHLKGIDGLPWKEIVVKFNKKMGLEMRQPALQMRLTRLAFRMDSLWAQEMSQKVQETTYLNSQPIHSSYFTASQSSARNESIFSQTGDIEVTTAPIPGLELWSGISEKTSYFITNPSSVSHVDDSSLYYEYNFDRNSSYNYYSGINSMNAGSRL